MDHRIFIGSLALLMACGTPVGLGAQPYNVYFGDLHSHSDLSLDKQPGALPPAQAYAYAKHVAEIDFLAISDHTHSPDLNVAGYNQVIAAARAYDHPDSHFVAIVGQELGLWGPGGYGHMNIFESPVRADNDSNDDTRLNLLHAYDFLIRNQLLGQFNHPLPNGSSNFSGLSYYAPVDPWMATLEVLNGKRSENYEQYYLAALQKGWHVGAVGDQDNHARNYGNTVSSSGDIYLTGVLAESLTKPAILEAIRARRTYAFQTSPAWDRIALTEFTANDHWMGESFAQSDTIVRFRVRATAPLPFRSAQLYRNGYLLQAIELSANAFTWEPVDSSSHGSVYYLVKLVQEDTDMLWSSPIWVNSPGEYLPPMSEPIPIARLRENWSNGVPSRFGQMNLVIQGVVTVATEFGSPGPGFLQDSTGGVAIFGEEFVKAAFPGFEMRVTGAVDFFNGLTEVTPFWVERVAPTRPQPTPIAVTTHELAVNGEHYEGSLVRVSGVRLSGNFPPLDTDANLSIDDGSGPCTLRIDKDTDIDGTPTPQGKVNIIGVVGQFDLAPPYNDGYQLMPRKRADITVVSGVGEVDSGEIPLRYALHQNHPNPFNSRTVIRYELPRPGWVSLRIYDLLGREVRSLINEDKPAGFHQVAWDGKDNQGQDMPSGIYLYRLGSGRFASTRKLIVMH